MHFQQAIGHHREIRHHVVLAEEGAQRFHHLRDFGVVAFHQLAEFILRLPAPVPRILEGGDLRVGFVALRRFEQQVVIALGIERRIEIDQIHRFVGDVLTEYL